MDRVGSMKQGTRVRRRHPIDEAAARTAGRFQAYARLVSVDAAKNRFRFYTMTWQPLLWGGGVLLRIWGRLGTKGRSLLTHCEDRPSAQELIDQAVRRRLQRGYHVVDAH
jgi:predicted DNA-binding WGR domain protein